MAVKRPIIPLTTKIGSDWGASSGSEIGGVGVLENKVVERSS
jgi:hypothetical protein